LDYLSKNIDPVKNEFIREQAGEFIQSWAKDHPGVSPTGWKETKPGPDQGKTFRQLKEEYIKRKLTEPGF